MLISVILVSYNTAAMTCQAIETLLQSKCSFDLQLIVIDNASRDNSIQMIQQAFPQITLIENKTNVGFGRANNQAIPLLKGDYVLLLNTDAFVAPDTLGKTVAFMQTHPDVGILGVKLVGRNGDLQPSCRYFPTVLNLFLQRAGLDRRFPDVKYVDDMDWDHATPRLCDWVPGCYYLIRKEVIEQVGLFDPRYFLYNEEVDHCKTAKNAGWQVMFFPETEVVHIGGESAKSDGAISQVSRQLVALQVESELLYFRKHYGLLSVMTHLLLQIMADFILMLKSLVKLKPISVYGQYMQHVYLFCKFACATYLGKHPTK